MNCALQLFNFERYLAQGTFLLCLWPTEVEKQVGPAPDSGSHPAANACAVLSMELPEIGSPVVFPDKVPNQLAPRADYNFRDLQHDDQQQQSPSSMQPGLRKVHRNQRPEGR